MQCRSVNLRYGAVAATEKNCVVVVQWREGVVAPGWWTRKGRGLRIVDPVKSSHLWIGHFQKSHIIQLFNMEGPKEVSYMYQVLRATICRLTASRPSPPPKMQIRPRGSSKTAA